jgi:hypothetical protein
VCASAYAQACVCVRARMCVCKCVCKHVCAGARVRARVCGRACARVCAYMYVRAHVKGLKAPFLLVSFLPKRGPAPLLLMPEASLGGPPGIRFFPAVAASHSACAALSPATRSACAFAASPSAAFFSLAVRLLGLKTSKQLGVTLFVSPLWALRGGLGGFPGLSPFMLKIS